MSLKINVNVTDDNYFSKLLLVLSVINPFSRLSNTELSVYAELLLLNYQHRKIPFTERNMLIFNKDNKELITNKLNLSTTRVDACLSRLRKLGLIEGKELVPKYIINKVPQIIFVFSEDNGEE